MPPANVRLIASLFAVHALVLITIVFAGIGGVTLVDAVRAYAMGESYYTKGQRSAVLALHRYAHTRDPAAFADYEQAIAVPVSDRRAREVLEDRAHPATESHAFLAAGGNHADDVATLAWFFRLFGDTALFRGPLETWREADAKITEFVAEAEALRRAVESGAATEDETAARLRRIDALDAELAALGLAFTDEMGAAARTLKRVLHVGIGGLGAALALLAAGFTIHATRSMRAANAEIHRREARFRDVTDLAADWIWETDAELRFTYLSDRIEAVTGVPKATFLGRRRWDLGADPGPDGWEPHIATMQRQETFTGFEYTLTETSGGTRVFRISGKPVHAEDGGFLGYRGTGTDVTAEVAARRELEEKRALLEITFENLGQGVSVVDADLNVVAYNRRFLELLDFPAEAFAVGDPYEKFIRYNAERGEYGPGDVEAMVRERVGQAAGFGPDRFERTRPDGTVLAVSGQPLPSGGFVRTYRDITAERHMRTALEASEARMRAVIDGALDAIVTIDAEGRITEFNAAAETILGWSREEAIGRPLAGLVIPERYRAQHLAGLARHLETGSSSVLGRHVEVAALCADGREIPVELSITAGTAGGAPIFTGFLRDITARKEAEAARREAERLLWAFLDGSPELIALKDLEGRYLLCNRTFEEVTGIPRQKVVGHTDRELFDRDEAFWESVHHQARRAVEAGAPVREEREEPDAKGRLRTFAVTKFPVFDGAGAVTGVGTFNQDITELKRAEHQLRQALKMQAVGELTGGVAHDFNNLLAVVLGNLELLQERLEVGRSEDGRIGDHQRGGDPALARLAEGAIAAARRGATITRRLLAFARQQPLQPTAIDVRALLGAMTDLLRQSVGESVELAIHVADDVGACFADPAELEAALLNLAVNARDAMPEGGQLTIEATAGDGAETACAAEGPRDAERAAGADGADGTDGTDAAGAETGEGAPGPSVVFTVSDTGCGMSPEVQGRAFEPFFTTKAPEKGSGLGLSMVYGFARQSGGRVTIRSAPGAGTSVRLCVPRAAEAAVGDGAGETEAAAPRGNAERILVAEDDDRVREQLAAQLESLGYRVTAAPDGARALAALKDDGDVDLLLTDIVMPGGMNGFELAEAAHRLRPGMPVLFTSGYLKDALPGEGRVEPGARLLRKPYRREELARETRLALGEGACDEAGQAARAAAAGGAEGWPDGA